MPGSTDGIGWSLSSTARSSASCSWAPTTGPGALRGRSPTVRSALRITTRPRRSSRTERPARGSSGPPTCFPTTSPVASASSSNRDSPRSRTRWKSGHEPTASTFVRPRGARLSRQQPVDPLAAAGTKAGPMDVLLTIGDFAKMTYLSIKALRHYHDIGLLIPADVDPETGYRRYRADQVPAAQVIRRLRDLGMPLEDVKAVLDAPDLDARNAGIGAHLRRMEQQLEQTQATVASLRRLLEQPPPAVAVEYRATWPARVLALRSQVAMNDAGQWWSGAFDQLHATVAAGGLSRSGPDGALYSPEFF